MSLFARTQTTVYHNDDENVTMSGFFFFKFLDRKLREIELQNKNQIKYIMFLTFQFDDLFYFVALI